MKLTDLVEGEEYAWDRGLMEKWKVIYTGRTHRRPIGHSWQNRTTTVAVVQVVRFGKPGPGQDLREVPARKLEPWAVYEATRNASEAKVAEREALFNAIDDQLKRLGLPLHVHTSFTGYTLYAPEGMPAVLEALKQLERSS